MKGSLIGRVAQMPAEWRLRVLQQLSRWGIREETTLIVLAVIIGLIAAGAAWLFEFLLHFIQRYYFANTASALRVQGYWIFLIPLLPAAGGLAVSLVRFAFREGHSKLHGLSNVLLSLVRNSGRLHPTVGLRTMLTSTLTIGTGGSAGPEAPIAIIGSSIGSLLGDLAGISRRNFPTLVGCGAAGGISAVFDAPIAGVLFAMEVMLRDFSVKTFTPIVISAVVSTTMFHTLRNWDAHGANEIARGLFEMPTYASLYQFTFREMPWYVGLGILCGLLSVLFTWLMGAAERGFEKTRIPLWLRPAVGAGLSGVAGVALVLAFWQHPLAGQLFAQKGYVPIFAGGYETIRAVISPDEYTNGALATGVFLLPLAFLATTCVLKIVATSLTLGGGGAGGVFAPSIFVGALGGAAYGVLVQLAMPDAYPSAYALVGMGSVLSAMIQAPLMAIILLFELTRDYNIMLPIMLSAVSATLIHQLLVGDGIYTLPLRKQGVYVGSAVGASALRRVIVEQLPLQKAPVVRSGELLSTVLERSQQTGESDFVALDEKGRYLGLLTLADLKVVLLEPESAPLLVVGEVIRTDVPPLTFHDTAERALELFARHEVSHLAVMDRAGAPGRLQGLLSRGELMKRYQEELTA